MDLRASWLKAKSAFQISATALCIMAVSLLVRRESDFTYILIGASPFLLILAVSFLWMAWNWAKAPRRLSSSVTNEISKSSSLSLSEKERSEAMVAKRDVIATNREE